MNVCDTIYALSTRYGKSGIAIIRVSGPKSLSVLESFGFKKRILPRVATLGKLYDVQNNDLIDEVLILFFPKNHSYTGEDMIEIHTHGSIAIIKAILYKLASFNYLRVAHNGEFTRLALKNNKISLIHAEAIISLINAETECQRKLAMRQYNGELEVAYIEWRKRIVHLIALVESYIDFPDDLWDIRDVSNVNSEICDLCNILNTCLHSFEKAKLINTGVYITIVGSTNVGKSTLINKLSNDNIAIVSGIHGTTRDVLKSKIELLGVPIIIHDTAGIRDTCNEIELIGIARTKQMIGNSDIIIVLFTVEFQNDFAILADIKKYASPNTKIIVLLNKIDLDSDYHHQIVHIKQHINRIGLLYEEILGISLKQDLLYSDFITLLQNIISQMSHVEDAVLATSVRHKQILENCVEYLRKALVSNILDIKAQELRFVSHELGMLLGHINTEEILDDIFSSFCVGK